MRNLKSRGLDLPKLYEYGPSFLGFQRLDLLQKSRAYWLVDDDGDVSLLRMDSSPFRGAVGR